MRYFTYIVKCADGSFYTGITWNLLKRIREHNQRTNTPLQICKIPVSLVFWQQFSSKQEAAKRDKKIKGWSRFKKIALIESLH